MKERIRISLILSIMIATALNVSAQVSEQDSLVLVALYNSTGGDNWTNNENWLSGPVGTWHGIDIENGQVSSIALANNNLIGRIPVEIGDLDSLRSLYLNENMLSDTIPSEIGNLFNLNRLRLYYNQLEGPIPPEIGNLTNLESLGLDNNQLTDSIPPELGNLVSLNDLSLRYNQLIGGIPIELGNCTNLKFLELDGNELTGSIPDEIGQLTKLIYFRVQNNNLSGTLPDAICNLTDLIALRLEENGFEGVIPSDITNLTDLELIWIYGNKFTDLPDLSSMPTLIDLKIQENRFTFEDIEPNIGIATFIYSPQDSVGVAQDTTVDEGTSLTLSVVVGGANNQYQWFNDGSAVTGAVSSDYTIDPVNLTDAGVYTCDITNTVAPELTLHSRPIQVHVESTGLEQDSLALVALYNSTDGANWTNHDNWLSGPVDTWFGITVQIGRVSQINLSSNNLIGTIPHEIDNLMCLTGLYLQNNQLTDSIPSRLGNLTNLISLNLSNNQLTDSIPSEIGDMTNLRYLNLYNNQLIGSIPPEVFNLVNLTYLDLSNNQLNGSILSEIGNLTALEQLYLHKNQLTGSIPPQLGNLMNLSRLNLSNNQLNGSIPSELFNLTNLDHLYLNDNQLEGCIPSQIGNLVNLIYLYLSNNELNGSIPSELGNLTNLSHLDLHLNQLTGSIPHEFVNLVNLTYLYLSYNELNGPIPPELGNLTNLTALYLHDNQLTGSIPPQLGNLTNLSVLNLSQNQLTDSIPAGLMNLTNLTSLLLTNNQFIGSIPSGITDLTNLKSIYIENNGFTDLPDLSSMPSLTNLYMERNRFTFEDIEPNLGIPNFRYAPQDSVGEARDITLYEGTDLTLSIIVGGANNQYQWFKDGSAVAGAVSSDYTIDPVNLVHAGVYTCDITNTVATELTLQSRPIQVNVESTGLQQDSLALVALYNSTDGANWTNNTNWLSGSVETWYGITVSGNRVFEIDLDQNNLSGPLPVEIGDLTALTRLLMRINNITGVLPPEIGNCSQLRHLYLYENQFSESVPDEILNCTHLEVLYLNTNDLDELTDLSSIITLTDLRIQDNRFTFEDIEPNIGISTFTYSPQDSVGEQQDTTVTEGESLNLIVTVGGTANQYQWFKNGVEITDSNSSTYVIESVALSDSGVYTCQVTNTVATELTLYSRPIDVHVIPGVGVVDRTGTIPTKFTLLQNCPNPFNPETKIEYHLPQPSEVKLMIFDVRGQIVRELVQGLKPAGCHEVVWDSRNSEGQKVAAGIYIYRIEIKDQGEGKQYVDGKKMVLMK